MDLNRFLWDPLFEKQVAEYFGEREKRSRDNRMERKSPMDFIDNGCVVVFLDEDCNEHPFLYLNDYFVAFNDDDEETYSQSQIVKVYKYDPRDLPRAFREEEPDFDNCSKLIWRDNSKFQILEEIASINKAIQKSIAHRKELQSKLLDKE